MINKGYDGVNDERVSRVLLPDPVECVLCVALSVSLRSRRRVERSRTQFDQTASASSEPATAVWCVLAVYARCADRFPDPLFTLTGAQNLHGHPSNLCEPCAVRSLTDPFTYAVRCAIHDVPGGRRPCGGAPRRPLGRARGRSVHGGWPGLLHHHWQHRDGCGLHRG